ncbi:MAG: hypothetical protein M3N50_07345, partial [Pseudomonadota bacterium]|nr:hypothetical protein [Pseudomonadota bacterium]
MTISPKNFQSLVILRTAVALALSAGAFLGGCVAQVRVAPPPPPRVYAPPPPPDYGEPVPDIQLQASEAPPPLPDYEQPPCPEEGYLWTPGYWGYGRG